MASGKDHAGKTALPSLYDPSEETILPEWDGYQRTYMEEYMQQFSVVFKRILSSGASIGENVGCPGSSSSEHMRYTVGSAD